MHEAQHLIWALVARLLRTHPEVVLISLFVMQNEGEAADNEPLFVRTDYVICAARGKDAQKEEVTVQLLADLPDNVRFLKLMYVRRVNLVCLGTAETGYEFEPSMERCLPPKL